MKRLILAFLLFIPLALHAQWTIGSRGFVVPSVGGGSGVTWTHVPTATFARCGAGTTCTMSGFTPTTANSVLIATVYGPGLTGCSGGGGTWVTGTGSNFVASVSGQVMAFAYNITGTGGATSGTCTFSPAQSSFIVAINEWKRSTGVPTLDQFAATNLNTSSCTSTCTLSSFSGLTGTSDLLVQSINFDTGIGNPSAPYVFDEQQIAIYALNSTQTTAPTISQTSGVLQSLGIAFK